MKRLFMMFCIATWFLTVNFVLAQENGETSDSETTEERICIPAEEAEQSAGEESGPSEEGTVKEEETALPVCDEVLSEGATPGDTGVEEESTPEDPESEEEEGISDDFDPSQEFEVDPEDEISEDYPVPLPSDI